MCPKSKIKNPKSKIPPMPLVDSASIVNAAHKRGNAIVQLNTNGGTYDLIRAVVETAEEERAPVILGAYEANLAYRGFEYAGTAMRYFAEQASVPVAIHLDHGSSIEACRRAIEAGFTSVMIDGSNLPIDENVIQTCAVVEIARAAGVSVEAEVGELQKLNPDGSVTEVKNLSNPMEAERMATETGIDMLAVGFGTAHGFYKGRPELDFQLLERLSKDCTIPLVLHGTTGLADEVVRRCISLGLAKVNLGTLIRTRYVELTGEVIAENQHAGHPWRVSREVLERIKEPMRHILRVAGSAK